MTRRVREILEALAIDNDELGFFEWRIRFGDVLRAEGQQGREKSGKGARRERSQGEW